MSSESEWSCRVEGSGSQCNVLIQPNHQTVLVREGQHRQKRKKEVKRRMKPNTVQEYRQKVSHIRDVKDGKDSKQRGRETEREKKSRVGVNWETSACRWKGKEETCQNSSNIFTMLINTHFSMQVNPTIHKKNDFNNHPPPSLSLRLTHTQTLVLRFRPQNLGFLHRCPLICWRETWGQGLGSETDMYLLLLPSGAELWVRVFVSVSVNEWASEWGREWVRAWGKTWRMVEVCRWVSEWMSLHAVRRTKHKKTDKGERRENENKWQAGFRCHAQQVQKMSRYCVRWGWGVCVCGRKRKPSQTAKLEVTFINTANPTSKGPESDGR